MSKGDKITEAEFVFLRSFYPQGKGITLKELMKRTGYSYERANSYLKSLALKKAVTEEKIGKTLVYSFDFKRISSKIAYYLYATKRAEEFSTKKKDIFIGLSELPEKELDFCAIFGSYAKGTEKEGSDIDLLCVSEDKDKVETAITSIKRRYNLSIHPLVIPKKEFYLIKNDNSEFWNDLVNY